MSAFRQSSAALSASLAVEIEGTMTGRVVSVSLGKVDHEIPVP